MSIRKARLRNVKRQQTKTKMDGVFNLMVKTISIAPFFLISYGALLLFLFAKSHEVTFLDLLTVNILLAFGALYLIFAIFLTGTMIVTVFFNHLSSNFIHSRLIKKSKLEILRENPSIITLILGVIFSCWPFVFLIKDYNIAILTYAITLSIVLITYHNLSTTDLSLSKPWSLHRLASTFLILSPAISLVTVAIFINVFIEPIRKANISDTVGVSIMATVLSIINFISFYLPMIEKKKDKKPESAMFIASICFYFLLLPNSVNEHASNALVKQLGIGLQNRCYLKKEIDALPIEPELKKQNYHIIELSVVVNINNIYYISKQGDPDMVASMRFIAERLTQVGCPDVDKNKREISSNSK